jgi:RHS repeat-associated protein
MVINGVSQKVTFDELGRVTVVTNVLGVFTNAYLNATPSLSSVTYPNGQVSRFSYLNVTNDQRLETIWNTNSSGATISRFDYAYNAEGQITNWTQELTGVSTNAISFGYDRVNQLLDATVKNAQTAAILKQFIYNYDGMGNRLSEQINTYSSGGTNLSSVKGSFNDANQLTNVVATNAPIRFSGRLTNDAGTVVVGTNAATMSLSGTSFVAHVDLPAGTNTVEIKATDFSSNRATNTYQVVVTNSGVARLLRYDLNGNLTNSVTSTATNNYEWDAVDRLTAVVVMTSSATNRSEFTYDGQSRRVRILEKTNGVTQTDKRYLWCGTEICEERDSTGASVNRRFFGQGEQISGTAYFYTRDHLGSVRELTDGSQTVRARYDYDPYGRRTKVSGDLDAIFGYTGHLWHQNSGGWLTLYRAYDPEVGRWLSKDPISEVGGLNVYTYGGNNPINVIDLFGKEWRHTLANVLAAVMLGIKLWNNDPTKPTPVPKPPQQEEGERKKNKDKGKPKKGPECGDGDDDPPVLPPLQPLGKPVSNPNQTPMTYEFTPISYQPVYNPISAYNPGLTPAQQTGILGAIALGAAIAAVGAALVLL